MRLEKVRKALAELATALNLNNKLLARAQRRYKANRKRAYQAHSQQIKYQQQADRLNREGHKLAAQRKSKLAARRSSVATKNHNRAQHYIGVIKTLQARIEGLDKRQAELEAERKKLSHVTIKGDRAEGGSPRERLKAVALASAAACSSGQRNNFYSQSGPFDAKHCITGPSYGHRDDCSSWFASVYNSAGLPDPSNEGYRAGWTGTLVAFGKQVSHPKPGDAIIYGSGSGHHVEMYVGPGHKTIGHGSAPVDAGTIDLFGDGDFRFFTYVEG